MDFQEHRQAVVKVLKMLKLCIDTPSEDLVTLITPSSITKRPTIAFTDADLSSEGRDHDKPI